MSATIELDASETSQRNIPLVRHHQWSPLHRHCPGVCTRLKRFGFGNGGARDPNFPDVKSVQADLLCQAIAETLAQEGQELPVILAGDFNSLWRKYKSDQWDQAGPSAPPTQLASRQPPAAGGGVRLS